MPYYLGIDGGGSKTTCAVGDDTSLLATVTSGPSNIVRVGEARAREALHQAVRQACAAAGVTPQQVQRGCIGAAGAAREEVAAAVRKILAEVLPAEIEIVGDTQIGMEAAFGTGPGVLVIGGTGSIAYGRDAQGKTARAGGWGFAISDAGSAHWIGLEAVRLALRAADENANVPPLLETLLQVRHSPSLDEFVRTTNSNPDFAAFFPAVVEAAASDPLARQVLNEAGIELAHLAAVVIAKLFAEHGSGAVPLAMVGGVFRHAPAVRAVFYNEIRRLPVPVEVNPEIVEPVHGALQMARRLAAKTMAKQT